MLNSQGKFEAFTAGVFSHDNLLHYDNDELLNYTFGNFETADRVWKELCGCANRKELEGTKQTANDSLDYLSKIYRIFVGGLYHFFLGGDYLVVSWSALDSRTKREMADAGHGASAGGIPLHEFRREVPPGWSPNIADYPLRLYFERLKLWYRIYDGADEMVGPLVAGRLQGKAQRLSMQLRLPRPDGTVDVGSDALVRLSVEEVRDPGDPSIILQRAIPSGVQALCNALRDTFGMSDQEMVSKSIEDLFEFRRGKLSLAEYSIEFDARLEEAVTRAGLELNDVGRFYLFFRGSGLSHKFIDDVKLQIQGDLRRFQEARALALRLVSRKDDHGESYYQNDEADEAPDLGPSWDDAYWADDGWQWVEDPYDFGDLGDWTYGHDSWYENDEDWYGDGYGYDEYYDAQESMDPRDGHAGDLSPSAADEGDVPASGSENYPMKGKGLSCAICGSRWHSTSSCPVGNGKGKGGSPKGSSKGYGKSFGKGKKGFGKSRGKGKGKWTPRFFKGRGKGKAKGYHGYAEKTLIHSFNENVNPRSPVKPKPKFVHFRLDQDDGAPVLELGRARHEARPETETAESDAVSAPEKRLDFTFATCIYNSCATFHTVRGEKRRGLLVDPGAASGLVGSETLRDLMECCIDDSNRDQVRWCHDRSNSVSGISGTPEATLGEIHLPISLAGAKGLFSADVLGGEGSLCPALLSNPALRKRRASILCDYFANGDGVLVVPGDDHSWSDGKSSWHYLRMLLTDSGHYLLPVDDQRTVSMQTQEDVSQHLALWSNEIQQRWNDVRHCFLQAKCEPQCRERERCSMKAQVAEAETDSNPKTTLSTTSGANSLASATSSTTTTASKNDGMSSLVSDDSFVTGSNPETTSSTTSGHFIEDVHTQSGVLCEADVHTQSGVHSGEKPFLDAPSMPPRSLPKEDSWSLEDGYLVRYHNVPRRILFTPSCTSDCPTDPEMFLGERTTFLYLVPRKRGERVLQDDWIKSGNPNKDMEQLWTGRTVFKLRKPKKQLASTTATTSEEDLDAALFPSYSGDMFPDHWTEEQKTQSSKKYRAMPEEFYTKSGRKPITPKNVDQWLQKASGRGLRWQFWEWCSGSGRLSLMLMAASMAVGFPVDYRYGWDLAHPPHQVLLRKCHSEFCPAHLFAAPTCTPWSVSSSSKPPDVRDKERQAELPTLEFIYEVLLHQHNQNLGFTVEQPYGSGMLVDSPVARLRDLGGTRAWRLDQCMLGAQCEQGHPIKKPTALLSNRRWKMVVKRCDNHRGAPHGVLQGQVRGINRTAMAAVYPKRLCLLYGQDLWSILRKDNRMSCKPWPQQLLWVHGLYYSCERCQLGRAAPPGCEHTMIAGQCRYGQPGMRRARATAQHAPPVEPPAPPAPTTAPAELQAPEAPTTTPVEPPEPPAPPLSPKATAKALSPTRTDLDDPTGPFKFLARNGDYSKVKLVCDADMPLNAEQRLFVKAALLQMLRTCIDLFQSYTAVDYDYWLEDPVLLQVFQEIFADHFSVLGVMCSLRPWRRKVPDPYLSSACAPLRLLIEGDMRQWHVHAVEDMRLMSHNQLHLPVDEANWHFHLFGVKEGDVGADLLHPPPDPRDGDPNGPRGSSSRARRAASSAQPAAPLAAPQAPSERENDGRQALDSDGPDGPPDDEGDDGEEFEAVRQEQEEKVLKPLFDFKKVFKRLQSGLMERDPATAKRLLLGLHERFYHAPIGDFKNMLLRAGLSSDVLPLAEEAVMSCAICRKYVRLPNRPQVKLGASAGVFNARIQADLFVYKEVWLLLIIDEATRYKVASSINSRDFAEITRKMVEHWFTVFGAPMQLVMDQETGMMSHEAGKELERFSIERVPKGTTSGEAGKQHTGTGLIERHIGLMQLTMHKLEAELDRQGIAIKPHELARESAMAQNQSLNYDGATPSMAVFGVLPRPFYQEDSNNIVAVAGALQTDITPFERALRIRQMSLSTVQKAIAEDRVARANRTRTHQLRLEEMVPGTTMVDYYREVNGDVGWRGPAELLKLNKAEGSAILSYQGRPYLVSLRHIRPHQAGVFVTLNTNQEDDLKKLRILVEKLSPYKMVMVGWVAEKKDDLIQWRRASTSSLAFEKTWCQIVSLSRALSRRNVGGAMLGQSVRAIHPPRETVGVLLYWTRGQEGFCCHEHNNHGIIAMKKITTSAIDSLAMIYVYFYVFPTFEPDQENKVLPPEGYDDADASMAGSSSSPMSTSTSIDVPDEPMSPTSPTTSASASETPMSVDDQANENHHKRKGPDSRTIVIGPEAKKSKLDILYQLFNDNQVTTKAQHNLINLYWVMHWTQSVPTEYPNVWQAFENSVYMAQWDIYMSRGGDEQVERATTAEYLFVWPGKSSEELRACLRTAEVFKVDEDTDNISEEECFQIWDQVDKADEDEVKQFVETKSFQKAHRNAITSDTIVIDATWIRKWKRYPDGRLRVKSRLCARGCFDKQKDLLSTRSTTATRLSQRILVSMSAIHDDGDLESWDISGAFLKGLTFEKVREMLLARGIKTPVRKVAIIAPANVWRHLGKFDPRFRIDVSKVAEFVLICIKPVYGLSDAPLAWQLCLHSHFEEQKGTASLMDENYFYWRDSKDGYSSGVTTHVDDCGAAGSRKWLDEQYALLVSKFGKVTRQKLPFTHCGVLYSRTQDGIKMSQDEFCGKLKMAPVPSRRDEDSLTAEELTNFRSILGGLLWLTATRLDLVSDVCALQSQVTKAKVGHLKQANNVVKKAKAELNQNVGLHYRRLRPPLRLACVHDSSAAGNVRNYAQEGVLILLCEDKLLKYSREEEHVLEDHQTRLLGGRAHVLWGHGAKAKRISYSTSHAETLAAISGLEASSLVAVRLAELLYLPSKASLQALIATQEQGIPRLPVDTYTDCRDFFELASGDKSVSQDKNQRLYILAFREARMMGRIRFMILCPTESMTADALTKSMVSPPLMRLLSCGDVEFYNQGDHKMTMRSLPRLASIDEKHFDLTDKQLIREVSTLAASSLWATSRNRFIWTALMTVALLPTSSASTFGPTSTSSSTSTSSTAATSSPSSTSSGTTAQMDDWMWFITLVVIVISTERLLCQSVRLWWRHLFGTTTTPTPARMDVDDEGDDAGDMDVDEAYIGEDSAMISDSSVPSARDLQVMIRELKTDRDQCRDLAAKRHAEIRHLRELSDNRWRTIEKLSEELQIMQSRQQHASEIFTTSATCKVYHRNRQCYHIRTNNAVKGLRPCKDCVGAA